MEQRSARQILQTLAQGRDPFTGTELASDSLIQHPEVVRALLAATAALEISAAREQRRAQLPGNIGRAWSESEEQDLVLAFRSGENLEEVAARHGRSLTAIEARLEKLGFLTPEQRTTRNKFVRPGSPQSKQQPGGPVYGPNGLPADGLMVDGGSQPLDDSMVRDSQSLFEDGSGGPDR